MYSHNHRYGQPILPAAKVLCRETIPENALRSPVDFKLEYPHVIAAVLEARRLLAWRDDRRSLVLGTEHKRRGPPQRS